MAYCEPANLYQYGLPRGGLPNEGRLAGSVSVALNSIELDGHGFATDDTVRFRAEAGGSLPSPIAAETDYYVITVNDDRFSVSASIGGSAVDFTTAGSRVIVIAPLPLASACTWASRVLDDMLPAAVVPLTAPYPEIVVMTAAELAIWKLGTYTGAQSKSLTEMVDFAQKRIARWAKGAPVRGANAPESANLSASATANFTDSRGWSRYGGIG